MSPCSVLCLCLVSVAVLALLLLMAPRVEVGVEVIPVSKPVVWDRKFDDIKYYYESNEGDFVWLLVSWSLVFQFHACSVVGLVAVSMAQHGRGTEGARSTSENHNDNFFPI
jgi:hypothetical protein